MATITRSPHSRYQPKRIASNPFGNSFSYNNERYAILLYSEGSKTEYTYDVELPIELVDRIVDTRLKQTGRKAVAKDA